MKEKTGKRRLSLEEKADIVKNCLFGIDKNNDAGVIQPCVVLSSSFSVFDALTVQLIPQVRLRIILT